MSCIAPGGKDAVAPDAHYPAFREELICALLETLLAHPHGALIPESFAAERAASEADAVQQQLEQLALARSGITRQGTPPGAAAGGSSWEELPAAVAAVAAQQRTAELTEWLGCAKIALQVCGAVCIEYNINGPRGCWGRPGAERPSCYADLPGPH